MTNILHLTEINLNMPDSSRYRKMQCFSFSGVRISLAIHICDPYVLEHQIKQDIGA